MKIFLITALMILTVSCTSSRVSRNLASGAIGCPTSEISIVNETASVGGSHNFEAICQEQRFYCHYHETSGIDCTKALAPSEEEKKKTKKAKADKRIEGEYYYTERRNVAPGQKCVEDEGWPPSDKLLCKPLKNKNQD
jgi:hypothetical protein